MPFIGKPEWSKAEGYLQLRLNLSDISESALVQWDVVKFLKVESTIYAYGIPRKFGNIEGDKLPKFGYVELHLEKWKNFKEEVEPSNFEKFFGEFFDLKINQEQTYMGNTMLSSAIALSVNSMDSLIQLNPYTGKVELPEFKVTQKNGSQNLRNYGLTTEQKIEFLKNDLKLDSATLVDAALVLSEYSDQQLTAYLALAAIVLK